MNAKTGQRIEAAARDVGLLVLRVMVGVVFIYHGGQKLFGLFGGGGLEGTTGAFESLGLPLPAVSAVMAGVSEFFGGVALLIGVGSRFAGLALTFTMLVAAFVASEGFDNREGGMEYPLTLAAASLAIALTGAGRLSIDHMLRRRLSRN